MIMKNWDAFRDVSYAKSTEGLKKILLLTFAGLNALSLVKAQPPDLLFSRSLDKIQLSSDNSRCIVQDSVGSIWIGTDNGLNVYNGLTVKSYLFKIGDSTSIPNNNIADLFVNRDGEIWIATYTGICVYKRETDNFRRLASEENYSGLQSLYTTYINQDIKGNIYVSASNNLYRYNRESSLFESVLQIKEGIINCFEISADNQIWIGSSTGGVVYFNLTTGQKTAFKSIEGDPASLANNAVRSLVLMGDSLWIATYGGGINLLDVRTTKFKRFPTTDAYTAFSFYTYIDRSNNLWTADLTGIKYFNKADGLFYGYYPIKGDDYSIKNTAVGIIQDRQGNYFTIHAPGGIGLSLAPKGFLLYNDNPGKYWRLNETNINAIAFDNEGNWWMGGGSNGIVIFNYSKGVIQSYYYKKDDNYSLGQGGVGCIFRDSKGKMWVGTNLGGLQYFDESAERFHSFIHNPSDVNSPANNDIRSVAEDKEGNLWIVTHGKGIDRFNPINKSFRHYTAQNSKLSNDWVFQVLLDKDETLWAATAWGLSKLKKGSDSFETYLMSANDSTSLSSNLVNCIFTDSHNRLWVGTSGGLNLWMPDKNQFIRLVQGLSGSNIMAVTEGAGYIWASTSKGIARVNPETFESWNFDEDDGLLKNGFLPRSIGKYGNQLFFGGANGMIVFDPAKLKLNTEVPEIILTGLKINYEPVTTYSKNSVLQKQLSQTSELRLAYNQNTIEISYVSNNLINSARNRYKYKMQGASDKWVDAGAETKALFTHLSPGNYTFTVIGSNNDNVWNETGATLHIKIRRPWWSTWVAYFGWASLLATIVILIIYQRTKNLQKQGKTLEKLVEERTKEVKQQAEELRVVAENLEEANQKLSQSNATKDKLFSIIAHDLKNPFNVILGYTDLLIENDDEWGKDEKLGVIHYIKDSSTRAYNLLENLLNWSGSQSGSLEFYPVPTRVADIFHRAMNDVASFAGKKKIRIENMLEDESLTVSADLDMMALICRNLLTNAIKFSKPGSNIIIDAEKFGESFVIFSVHDYGIGMDPEKAATLFDPVANTSSPGTDGEKGTGLGLLLCHEFVVRHNGKIWVESRAGEGTVFYFTIPLTNV